jgi:hypothetical protein
LKSISVVFSQDAEEEYQKLKKLSEKNKYDKSLLNSIERAIDLLKHNPHHGIQIKKKQISKKYIQKYGLVNLWKIDLAHYWRIVYTILPDGDVEIVNFVVDILDHKKYNKVFGY